MKQTFQDAFGNIHLILEYHAGHHWIHADFIGVQSLLSVQKGMNAVLELLVTHRCHKYLSDNTHILGGFTEANDWLRDEWTPQAMQMGMRHVAHVMAPGIFGRESMEELATGLPANLDIQFFERLTDAQDWLAGL